MLRFFCLSVRNERVLLTPAGSTSWSELWTSQKVCSRLLDKDCSKLISLVNRPLWCWCWGGKFHGGKFHFYPQISLTTRFLWPFFRWSSGSCRALPPWVVNLPIISTQFFTIEYRLHLLDRTRVKWAPESLGPSNRSGERNGRGMISKSNNLTSNAIVCIIRLLFGVAPLTLSSGCWS